MSITRLRKFDGTDKPDPQPITLEMEIALARHFNVRRNLIVPNCFWSHFQYEIDFLLITKSNRAWEVEIKVSLSDLKKDALKRHTHRDPKLTRVYFALPTKLIKHIDLVPEHAGVLEVYWSGARRSFFARKVRESKIIGNHVFTDCERYDFARLGAMRIWGVKEKLARLKREGLGSMCEAKAEEEKVEESNESSESV